MLWIEPQVIQNKHEHCQDRGLARAGGEGCEKIDHIEQLRQCLDLIIPRCVGPEVSKNFTYEPLHHPQGEIKGIAFTSHVGSSG